LCRAIDLTAKQMLRKITVAGSIFLSFVLVLLAAVPGESGDDGEVVYLPIIASPSPVTELAQLLPSNPVFKGRFGWSVDIDGSTAAVTTYPEDDVYPTGTSGTLYIFEQVTPGYWSLRGQFTSDGVDEFDWYGVSVAVSGATIAVGASRDDEFGANAGAVYLYQKINGSWQEIDKITADDVAPNDDFGIALALEGDTLIAGAMFHNGGGAAYAFEKNGENWQQAAKFYPELPDFLDFYGSAVALYQNTLAVGMPNEGECPNDDECDAGAVYVYEKDVNGDWNTVGVKLRPPLLPQWDEFGASVALKENVLSIGATHKNYIFEKSGGGSWQEITTLNGDDYGGPTAFMGSYIIAGAPLNSAAGSNAGAIILIAKDQNGEWQMIGRFTPAEASSGDRFGASVAATDDIFIVGMPYNDGQLTDAGSAFLLGLNSYERYGTTAQGITVRWAARLLEPVPANYRIPDKYHPEDMLFSTFSGANGVVC
jgi:hypothetical protein